MLGVEIWCERIVVDYYSFGLDDVKKGTNVSRLKKHYKVELGPHVSPSYVPVFTKLYTTLIADPIEFVRLEMEYREIQTKSLEGKQQQPARGCRRRDPDLITNTYMRESRKRDHVLMSAEVTDAPLLLYKVRTRSDCMCSLVRCHCPLYHSSTFLQLSASALPLSSLSVVT